MYGFWILLAISIFAYGQRMDPICGSPLPVPYAVSQIVPNVLVFASKKMTSFRLTDLLEVKSKIAYLEKEGYFKLGRQVVFIAHGFWNNELFNWQYKVKDEILNADDSTVLIVTWGAGSLLLSYPQAGANTKTVASVISAMAEATLKSATFKGDPNLLYLYCIGHSLGAQICGQAGRMSGHFDRVTGLDPAGPGFETCWSQNRVDKKSASCVDHIHTDGSNKGHMNPVVPYFGTLFPWGHIDFYPNGGEDQTGCSILTNDASCSHMKAIDYFTFSIRNRQRCIAAKKCTNSKNVSEPCSNAPSQQMGYFSSCHKQNRETGLVKQGSYFLKTNAASPFC